MRSEAARCRGLGQCRSDKTRSGFGEESMASDVEFRLPRSAGADQGDVGGLEGWSTWHAGLRLTGIDHIECKCGHKYLIIVVGRDSGRLWWAVMATVKEAKPADC